MSTSHRLEESLSKRRTASHRTPTAADVAGFRHAQGLGFSCAQAVAAEMRPGWTEGRTCRWMMDWLRDHGVRTMLHKPIVAIGPNSLAPDDQWGPPRGEGVTLREGDVAILDCSPVVDGYMWFLPQRPFGWIASWHGPGFLFTLSRRLVFPEVLGPHHHGPKTGVWAIEPHIRAGEFGAKFEELLIVEPDRAYWLDDISQRRITIAT